MTGGRSNGTQQAPFAFLKHTPTRSSTTFPPPPLQAGRNGRSFRLSPCRAPSSCRPNGGTTDATSPTGQPRFPPRRRSRWGCPTRVRACSRGGRTARPANHNPAGERPLPHPAEGRWRRRDGLYCDTGNPVHGRSERHHRAGGADGHAPGADRPGHHRTHGADGHAPGADRPGHHRTHGADGHAPGADRPGHHRTHGADGHAPGADRPGPPPNSRRGWTRPPPNSALGSRRR